MSTDDEMYEMTDADMDAWRGWPPLASNDHRIITDLPKEVVMATAMIDPKDCAAEIIARCQQCLNYEYAHISPDEYERLQKIYGDRWMFGYLIYLGWNTRVGLCETCYAPIKALAGRLN